MIIVEIGAGVAAAEARIEEANVRYEAAKKN